MNSNHLPFPPRVVIVESSADCREVLSAALGRRGMTAYAAAGTSAALRLIREHEPEVVVLDLEADDAQDAGMLTELGRQLAEGHSSLILLGHPDEKSPASQCVVPKPYHFAPLVHTIEELAAAKAA